MCTSANTPLSLLTSWSQARREDRQGHHGWVTQGGRWAREQFDTDLKWGIEDCRDMSARLEHDLLSAGQQVVRVPTKLMAEEAQVCSYPG